jgi:hypothetical protein
VPCRARVSRKSTCRPAPARPRRPPVAAQRLVHGCVRTDEQDRRQPNAARRARQASSHRRQFSAQSRQCSWCGAWRSHSSPHTRQAVAHAPTEARSTPTSAAVWRVAMRPVVVQMSLQSRQKRMQRTNSCTSASARSASAQLVQLSAQSEHSSIHRLSTARSKLVGCGCVWMISPTVTSDLLHALVVL